MKNIISQSKTLFQKFSFQFPINFIIKNDISQLKYITFKNNVFNREIIFLIVK